MGILIMSLGLIALLFVLFKRAGGMALTGSFIGLAVALFTVLAYGHTSMPQMVGMLYIAFAVGIWAAMPPAEELADPIGGAAPTGLDRTESAPPLPIDESRERVPTELSLVDQVLLVGLPLVGFFVVFFAVPHRTGLEDGVQLGVVAGKIGHGFAVSITDVSVFFGLVFFLPGAKLVLTLPVIGLAVVVYQFLSARPTAIAAAIEFGVVTCLFNLIALFAVDIKL